MSYGGRTRARTRKKVMHKAKVERLAKRTAKSLTRTIEASREKLTTLQAELHALRAEATAQQQRLREEVQPLLSKVRDEHSRILNDPESRARIFGIRLAGLKSVAQDRVSQLKAEIKNLEGRLNPKTELYHANDRQRRLHQLIGRVSGQLELLEEALPLATRQTEIKQAEKERQRQELEEIRQTHLATKKKLVVKTALAAMNAKETRRIARRYRDRNESCDTCPYCNETIQNGGHDDHIYPVAWGGKSTLDNIVRVCESCNSKKSDMTLAEFAEAYELSLMGIHARLKALGKRY